MDTLNNNILTNKPNLIKFNDIMSDEILKAISNLKNGLSPGFDKIMSEMLKTHNLILCQPLKYIYNF